MGAALQLGDQITFRKLEVGLSLLKAMRGKMPDDCEKVILNHILTHPPIGPISLLDIPSRFSASPSFPQKLYGINKKISNFFSSPYQCMHPDCSARAISSHSIQEADLKRLMADDTKLNRIFFSGNGKEIQEVEVGPKKAGAFPGYCNSHDTSLFASFEATAFTGSDEQLHAAAYRGFAREYRTKISSIRSNVLHLDVLAKDLERTGDGGYFNVVKGMMSSLAMSLDSLRSLLPRKRKIDSYLLQEEGPKVHGLRSRCFDFEGEPDLLSWGLASPRREIKESLVPSRSDSFDDDLLFFSTHYTEKGFCHALSWLCPETDIWVDHLLAEEEVSHRMIPFIFAHFEVTYFKRQWWSGLSSFDQDHLKHLAFVEGVGSPSLDRAQPPALSLISRYSM